MNDGQSQKRLTFWVVIFLMIRDRFFFIFDAYPPVLMHTETIKAQLPRVHFLNVIVHAEGNYMGAPCQSSVAMFLLQGVIFHRRWVWNVMAVECSHPP
ncbi:hypothetical protein TNCT_657041 [Trichonephila clavata]|uniref:Uncharacterized protein n=1 Tax=Trichonephila clavata TaxID=2740835 RepID=A0A8X6LAX6_TRICU|nr:hypothetical protein TNCT_657041 [Trichonephila clavata]